MIMQKYLVDIKIRTSQDIPDRPNEIRRSVIMVWFINIQKIQQDNSNISRNFQNHHERKNLTATLIQ